MFGFLPCHVNPIINPIQSFIMALALLDRLCYYYPFVLHSLLALLYALTLDPKTVLVTKPAWGSGGNG